MQPNGDAIFRGSQFQSRMNGGQILATENWFDGAAFGYAEGHQQTQESSIPYPSVREMTVVQNTFSAEYGHTSGGFITYATKSGTNKFHGSIYDFYTNNKLDASNWFVGPQLKAQGLNDTLPLGQNNWGFAVGGPIPKVKTNLLVLQPRWHRLPQHGQHWVCEHSADHGPKAGRFQRVPGRPAKQSMRDNRL